MRRLHYELKGTGKTTLFIHGYMESTTMWKNVVIPDGMQALFVDLPGHGQSLLADHPYQNLTDVALKISELLDELSIEAFNVIGHSMGGYVALELKKADERCQRVMLLNSNFWTDSDAKKRDRLRVAEIARHNHTFFVKEAIPALFSNPVRFNHEIDSLIKEAIQMEPDGIAVGALAMRDRMDNEALVREYEEEVMIVQGCDDTVVPIELMRKKIDGMNVDYHEIEGVGHMMHVAAPGILEELIARL